MGLAWRLGCLRRWALRGLLRSECLKSAPGRRTCRDGALLSGSGVFPLLLDLHVVPDCATYDCASDCMMTSDVPAYTSDGSTAEASSCEAGGSSEQSDENDWFQAEHGGTPGGEALHWQVASPRRRVSGRAALCAGSTGTWVAQFAGETGRLGRVFTQLRASAESCSRSSRWRRSKEAIGSQQAGSVARTRAPARTTPRWPRRPATGCAPPPS
jgi:hypothetical protein